MSRLHLFAAGSNGSAQLGVGHREDLNQFAPCVFAPAPDDTAFSSSSSTIITSLTSGGGHSLLLLSNGAVYVTGTSSHGEFGPQFSSTSSAFSNPGIIGKWHQLNLDLLITSAGLPLAKGIEYKAIHIGCAWTTSFIGFSRCVEGGRCGSEMSDIVLAFGSNDFGELGCGGSSDGAEDAHSPNRVLIARLPGWDDHITVTTMTSTAPAKKKQQERETTHIQHLAVSQRHIICVCLVAVPSSGKTEQRVYGWGAARHGQLTSPPPTPIPATSSSSAPSSTSASSSAGPSSTLPRTGDDKSNRRRVRSVYPAEYSSPVLINIPPSASPAAALPPSTRLADNNPNPNPTTEQITKVSLGARHTVFLFSSGRIVGIGDNSKSQLELPRARYEEIGCTWNGSVAVLHPGSGEQPWVLLSTGSNTHGQLGRPSSTLFSSASGTSALPSSSAFPTAVVDLAAKQVHLPVARITSGKLQDIPRDANPGGKRRMQKLACGSEHVIVLLSASTRTTSNSAVVSDAHRRNSPAAREDDGNNNNEDDDQTTDADDDDEVIGWGWNEHGNLGLGNTEDQSVPIRIPLPALMQATDPSVTMQRDKRRVRVRDVWAGCGTTWVLLEE